MGSVEEFAEKLRDKADRLMLAHQNEFNVPHFIPIRVGLEFKPPSTLDPKTLRDLEGMASHVVRFTIRTYKQDQLVGSEPLLLNVTFEEGLVLARLAVGAYSVSKSESIPSDDKTIIERLRARADDTLKAEGYSFGKEFFKLLSRSREGSNLNVLFQEYIDRDHAERSGRIAYYRDGRGVYSYKSAEAALGPIVRDVDYSKGVVSGMFSRLGEISDELMRTKVAHPMQSLLELFPWKQGVVVEFDYHSVQVGKRQERLIIYDFHEAEVTVQDVTGRTLSNMTYATNPSITVVTRPKQGTDPKEVTEQILSAVPARSATYISGEITTGLKFYQLLRTLGIEDVTNLSTAEEARLRESLSDLLKKNVSRMKTFAEQLHSVEPSARLINPGEIAVSDWSQEDYLTLWSRVIRWGVRRIYFLDGWEYSNGAAMEYCLGAELGLELLDEHTKVLYADEGLRLLRQAVEHLRRMGFDAPKLEECTRKLIQIRERRVSRF